MIEGQGDSRNRSWRTLGTFGQLTLGCDGRWRGGPFSNETSWERLFQPHSFPALNSLHCSADFKTRSHFGISLSLLTLSIRMSASWGQGLLFSAPSSDLRTSPQLIVVSQ